MISSDMWRGVDKRDLVEFKIRHVRVSPCKVSWEYIVDLNSGKRRVWEAVQVEFNPKDAGGFTYDLPHLEIVGKHKFINYHRYIDEYKREDFDDDFKSESSGGKYFTYSFMYCEYGKYEPDLPNRMIKALEHLATLCKEEKEKEAF